jgi:hypothetical protein
MTLAAYQMSGNSESTIEVFRSADREYRQVLHAADFDFACDLRRSAGKTWRP